MDAARLASEGSLIFPVLTVGPCSFGVKETFDDLTVVPTPLIKSGWFQQLHIIDCAGRKFECRHARVLGGSSTSWDSRSYGRRVRTALELSQLTNGISVGIVRADVMNRVTGWNNGWQSRDDYDDLLAEINTAKSVPDLITVLSHRRV